MPKTAQTPLPPQQISDGAELTFSSMNNNVWVSPITSHPSAGVDENRGRKGWKQEHKMASTRDIRIEARPSLSRGSSSGNVPTASSSLTSPPLSAFPAFDPAYDDSIISPPPRAHKDGTNPKSPSHFSQTKVKIKPFLRKISSQEKVSLDLSRSVAENEGLGIYTNSRARQDSHNSANNGVVGGGFHARTSSAVSQVSGTTNTSNHRSGTQYIHPMRQTPQSYAPPIAHSHHNSHASSDDDGQYSTHSQSRAGFYPTNNLPHSYAPLPVSKRTPPPLHVRTRSVSRGNSSSQPNLNMPGTPSSLRYAEPFSPDNMPQTARSSLESAFRKRSRNNTGTDPLLTVQALRAEFNAKEAAKEQKYAAAEIRAAEREARRQEKRDHSQRRREEHHDRKRARSRGNSEKSVPLSAIEYSSTAAFPVDEELEYIRRGVRPPTGMRRGTTSTSGKKPGKAFSSQWSLFWFKFKTIWLKFKRSMGVKSGS